MNLADSVRVINDNDSATLDSTAEEGKNYMKVIVGDQDEEELYSFRVYT